MDSLANTDWHLVVDEHGSPLNVLNPNPMRSNIDAILAVAHARGLDVQLHYAFKANKDIVFVETADQCSIGIDVASETELRRTLQAGVAGERIVCTAAIKTQALIDLCLSVRTTIVIDNRDEWYLINERADALGHQADVAIRLGGFRQERHQYPLATRFGFDVNDELSFLRSHRSSSVRVAGLHFHLSGSHASQRIIAIDHCLTRIAELREQGHPIRFLDIGGGFPARTWNDPDFVSAPDWFASILDESLNQETIAKKLVDSHLQLRCEPGRALLDGCGMTIARVEFCKPPVGQAADPLLDHQGWIGLAMNHTQCHPTQGNELADPIIVPRRHRLGKPSTGRFVGNFCTEFDFIAGRTFEFPNGIERGDLVVFANTAAYQMHFLESASHQNPLAKNIQVRP
ncbi:Diaminopimelate decarboxylase [Neorhodopirellula pilleata]|uniref:Diaminopimelate decarboxylase n=2 Tax=Neorhodopirellula pilleata TaxID=2714738 RepID=A0A5C5ZWY3_9BACT|nr:Diaminopimelate decarboxylase [Neorhodopirellula pilleata]